MLQTALLELLDERGYDSISVGDRLRLSFGEVSDSQPPPEVTANFLAGGVIALLIWWLETDSAYTPDEIASMAQRLASGQ